MRIHKNKRHSIEHDNVDRWLVSYADYMTLLFALFVVLYALAMVNEEPFETLTESLGRVFQSDQEKTKNKGHGDDILLVNTAKTNQARFGDGVFATKGPELTDGENTLSNVGEQNVGSNLSSLEEKLHTALYDLIESGYASLQNDGQWLEIELNSGLLFPSGSATATNSAKAIIEVIADVVGRVENYLRVRGYTDNQAIHNEIFDSNWELSVARAAAILRLLEADKINPARMAIEGYGQYYPISNNNTPQGRAENRRVVIALSKFAITKTQTNTTKPPTIKADDLKQLEPLLDSADQKNKIKVIQLDNGGIRITTRDDKTPPSTKTNNKGQ